jgi:biopolymer transport protein ExbD
VVDDIAKLATLIEDTMEEKQITERKVQLRADIELEYGKVVDVMTEIKSANIEIVALITEKSATSE